MSHPSVFAIRHVNVVTETCEFSIWIFSSVPYVAVLNRTEELGAYLFCLSICLWVSLLG